MSKISKFIYIPILALLLCFSIGFVGCSNKNNPSNNSNSSNSNNNNNNNVTPPQNINYFQELENYIKKNGEHFESQNVYVYSFDSSYSTTEDKNFKGELNYYTNNYYRILGDDKSNNSSIQLKIFNLTDYSGYKYSVSGVIANLYQFEISFTAENATVPFKQHNISTEDSTKFKEYVQMAQNIINTTIQSFSSYFSKKVLNSSDDMAFAKAFHLPTKVTITNTIQK